MIPFSQFCLAMKVAAAGPVSQEDAAAALQRYKKLEDGAPTMKQVGRYAGIGAVAAPVATVLKDTISGGKPILGGSGNRLRTLAGNAAAGALTSGGIPLLRAHMDREAEKNTLRKYVAQGVAPKIASMPAAKGLTKVKEKTSAMSGVTPAKPWAAGEYADMGKMGAGAPTRGGFLMSSEVAPWRQPKLHTVNQSDPQQIVEKMGAARLEWLQKRAGATTPAGRLASSHRVGLPKVSAPPGPSIADTVPTFGQRLPGANKTTIGKRSIRETPTLANTAPPQG
jgi:hypothetical protein